jgi:flagellar biogenesis protein FliO
MLGFAAGWKRLRGAAPAPGAQPAQAVQVSSTVSLGPQRFLHLVTVGRHQLLVGSSPQNVSLIAVLEGGAEPPLARERGSEEPSFRPHGPARESEEWPEALDAPADRFEELLLRMRALESGPHGGEPAGSRAAADSRRREAGRDASRGEYGSHPEAARASGPRGERDSVPRAGAAFEDGWSGRAGGATTSPARAGDEDRPLSPGSLFRTSGGTAGGGSDA